jgi:hypothetical protein
MTKTPKAIVTTRTQRLRRVLLLSMHFARNLGYYRAGMSRRRSPTPKEYWRTITSNGLDVCILEWCKLFADPKDLHHWRHIVSTPDFFEANLYKRLRCSATRFEEYRLAVREYRDKFVAHLDSHLVMEIPNLDLALSAACIYYEHVRESECRLPTLRAFPDDLFAYYQECRMEAANVLLTYSEDRKL